MNILEKLAELEHLQWAHWTKYMLDNLTPENIERWKKQIDTPYEALTEKEKESDRVWARKVLMKGLEMPAYQLIELYLEFCKRHGHDDAIVLPWLRKLVGRK